MSSAAIVSLLMLTSFFPSNEASSSSWISVAAPFAVGSRSLLRSVADAAADKPDYAVELNATNFDSVFKETSAAYAIVEFFAHWCPACRNYKPQYEKIARIFNGADAVHPGIIIVTRVDCAFKINTNLCDKFSVGHYPMLLWGPPSKFVSGSWDPKQEKSEIRSIDDGRTAELLLNWINKQLSSSYRLDDEKYENDQLQKNASDFGQIAHAIYDIEEATFNAFEIILDHKMIKSDTRASLVKFFQLLVVHHPSRRCRKGTAEILVDFNDFSINKKATASGGEKGALRNYQICGNNVPHGHWNVYYILLGESLQQCFVISSATDICNLAMNFLSRCFVAEAKVRPEVLVVVCGFCCTHFLVSATFLQHVLKASLIQALPYNIFKICHSTISIGNAVFPALSRSLILCFWLWDAHNKVNQRLMKEEPSLGTADPEFPKIMWPPRQLCPSCYLTGSGKNDGYSRIDWDQDEVYRFLIDYYGKSLVTQFKDKVQRQADGVVAENLLASTHAVVVSVGAALGIAVASCAFGALTCYWCQRKKSRKI
ncbi:UNVERIFIED_CONTAM: Sulfhydryl oxidase 1 [Sesamum calycinum]|uniref:Sulfhydryl oxidase 1 n=1 Tax=Sesamum calycinum TaxID=2727403 RepID=A0AAW2SX73_9LAMI